MKLQLDVSLQEQGPSVVQRVVRAYAGIRALGDLDLISPNITEGVYLLRSAEPMTITSRIGEPDRQRFSNDTRPFHWAVAKIHGQLVGTAQFYDDSYGQFGEGTMEDVYIDTDHRRKGVAWCLYDHFARVGFWVVPSKKMPKEAKAFWETRADLHRLLVFMTGAEIVFDLCTRIATIRMLSREDARIRAKSLLKRAGLN